MIKAISNSVTEPCYYHRKPIKCGKMKFLIMLIAISSVVRQKGESQNGYYEKIQQAKCSEKANIFYLLILTRVRNRE